FASISRRSVIHWLAIRSMRVPSRADGLRSCAHRCRCPSSGRPCTRFVSDCATRLTVECSNGTRRRQRICWRSWTPWDSKPMLTTDDLLIPEWPAPPNVRALSTTRRGGISLPPYGATAKLPGGLNLGTHVGDLPGHVAENRLRLQTHLPHAPLWLDQVHGCSVVTAPVEGSAPSADASIATRPRVVCAIMTADCLPVLLCDRTGSVVGAAHAGWRGLCAG